MPDKFSAITQHLQKEISTIQVGRASPALLEGVLVEAYGSKTPVDQLATITSQGATALLIQPWDQHILKEIERALRTCGRDYNPVVDGNLIRLPFPPLTEEKRRSLVKLVAEQAEAAKVQVKLAREELMQTIKNDKANKTISEDQAFAQQKDIQKQVDQCNQTITELTEAKSADIMKL